MSAAAVTAPWQLQALGRGSARELVRELAHAAAGAHTGVLRVTGEPGGDLHVVHGLVVAVASPGAPGVRELLSRPGRISTGVADLNVVALMSAVDGAFAIASGWIGGCQWQTLPAESSVPQDSMPPVPGVESWWLLLEVERRLCALAHGRISPHRNNLLLTERGRVLLSTPGTGQRGEILLWADGRRSCRDISMLLSRSLYAVTVEVVRMLDDDLLAIAPIEPERPAATESAPASGGRSLLPRRRRGASGINDTLPPRPPQPQQRGQRAVTPRKPERTS
ncbi:hypothetical protein [Nocardia sp. NBC_00511]|uniref:hypothetical protein n=1 Tax=Nocardia sp. NBC_00511 TaxID=2903591 RepID=UPI0030E2020B